MKALKILFFIKGPAPSPEQRQEALSINGNVCFRNAAVIRDGDYVEPCDGVAGEVPKAYKKLPSAKEAMDARAKKIEELSKAIGDSKAPKKSDKKDDGKTDPKKEDGGSDDKKTDAEKGPGWNAAKK